LYSDITNLLQVINTAHKLLLRETVHSATFD